MALDIDISNAETSPDPALGKVLGDSSPSTNHRGNITKIAVAHDELKANFEEQAALFDDHDHDPDNPTGPGGPLIGALDENGDEVAAIGIGQITEDLIGDEQITGGKTAAGAIGTNEIADETMSYGKFGPPTRVPVTVAAGQTATIVHDKGQYVHRHVECDNARGEFLQICNDEADSFQVANTDSSGSLSGYAVYWG